MQTIRLAIFALRNFPPAIHLPNRFGNELMTTNVKQTLVPGAWIWCLAMRSQGDGGPPGAYRIEVHHALHAFRRHLLSNGVRWLL